MMDRSRTLYSPLVFRFRPKLVKKLEFSIGPWNQRISLLMYPLVFFQSAEPPAINSTLPDQFPTFEIVYTKRTDM